MTREALLGHAWAQTALAVVLAVAVNHLAAAIPLRLDVTDDQRHSLSPVAADVVRGLQTPLTATVWFTEDLGPPYHQHRQALLDLLAELEVASRGQLEVVVRDPTGDADAVAAATAAGVRPVTWAYRDWDQTQARQVWMGLTLDHGAQHAAVDALPAIQRMEHDVVRAILAVTTPADDRKTIGWLQGDGEPTLAGHPGDHPLGRLRAAITARYALQEVQASEPIPDAIDALVVVGPQLPLSETARANLDAHLMRGGALAVFVTGWQPEFRTMQLRRVDHGLQPLLGAWGLAVRPEILFDRRHNEALVLPVAGGGVARVNHPLAPITDGFDRTAAPVRELRQAVLPFASAMAYTDPGPSREVAVWLRTEPTSAAVADPPGLHPDAWKAPLPGEVAGPHAAVIAVQGTFPSAYPAMGQRESAPTRLLLAGSADLLANQQELVLNGLDWLVDDPRLVTIRARSAGPAPFTPPTDPGPWKLAIGGTPLVGLALGASLVAWRRRR